MKTILAFIILLPILSLMITSCNDSSNNSNSTFVCSKDEKTLCAGQDNYFTVLNDDNTENILEISKDTFKNHLAIEMSSLFFNESLAEQLTSAQYATVLQFSEIANSGVIAQLSENNKEMRLKIEIPSLFLQEAQSLNQSIYLLKKTSGEKISVGGKRLDGKWSYAFGKIFEEESKIYFQLSLYATAENMTFILVRGPGFQMSTSGTTETKVMSKRSLTADSSLERPWAVFCSDGSFPVADVEIRCGTGPESAGDLGEILLDFQIGSDWLKGKGYLGASLANLPMGELYKMAVDQSVPLLPQEGADDGGDQSFNYAIYTFETQCGANSFGCFDPETRIITVNPDVLDPEDRSISGGGFGVTHELYHAVQSYYIKDIFKRKYPSGHMNAGDLDSEMDFIIEGTAAAMGMWHLSEDYSVPFDRSKWFDTKRDWSIELNDGSSLRPYEAHEFYRIIGSNNLNYLEAFFSELENIYSDDRTIYSLVDQAIDFSVGFSLEFDILSMAHASFNPALIEKMEIENALTWAMIKTLKYSRMVDLYPYCSSNQVGFTGDQTVVNVSDDIFTMSAQCKEFKAIGNENLASDGCFKIVLNSPDVDSKQLLIVENTTEVTNSIGQQQTFAYKDDPLWAHSEIFNFFVADVTMPAEGAPSYSEHILNQWNVKIEIDNTCGRPEVSGCYETKVLCNEEICQLMMRSDPSACWVEVGGCHKTRGCFTIKYGDRVYGPDYEFCGGAMAQLTKFEEPPVGESYITRSSRLPYDGMCGELNFCRRIILCAK